MKRILNKINYRIYYIAAIIISLVICLLLTLPTMKTYYSFTVPCDTKDVTKTTANSYIIDNYNNYKTISKILENNKIKLKMTKKINNKYFNDNSLLYVLESNKDNKGTNYIKKITFKDTKVNIVLYKDLLNNKKSNICTNKAYLIPIEKKQEEININYTNTNYYKILIVYLYLIPIFIGLYTILYFVMTFIKYKKIKKDIEKKHLLKIMIIKVLIGFVLTISSYFLVFKLFIHMI